MRFAFLQHTEHLHLLLRKILPGFLGKTRSTAIDWFLLLTPLRPFRNVAPQVGQSDGEKVKNEKGIVVARSLFCFSWCNFLGFLVEFTCLRPDSVLTA
ncbi:MAG: hypothetical protein AAGF27_01700 [Pseudomonadota bacterium]